MYNTIFIIIIAVLVFGYVLDRILDTLNLKYSLPDLPEELSGIFDPGEYKKSQLYKRDNTRFAFITSSLSIAILMLVFFCWRIWMAGRKAFKRYIQLHPLCTVVFRTDGSGK